MIMYKHLEYMNLLGLDTSATKEDIKEAYRLMALVWHPDKFENNQNTKLQAKSKTMMIRLTEAYDYLMCLYEKGDSSAVSAAPSDQAGESSEAKVIDRALFEKLDMDCRSIIEKEVAKSNTGSLLFNKDTLCVSIFTLIQIRIRAFVVTEIHPRHPYGLAVGAATARFFGTQPLNYIYEKRLPLLKADAERKAILLSLIMSAYKDFFSTWYDLVLKHLTKGW